MTRARAACVALTLAAWAAGAVAQTSDAEKRAAARCPQFFPYLKAHARPPPPAPVPPDAPGDPSLRALLLAMAHDDQAVRITPDGKPPSPQALEQVDAASLPRLEAVVAMVGFPSRSLVGSDGVGAAWLLVQHATADPAFQARVLPLVEAAVHDGALSGENFALLSDRVLMLDGRRPQRFGSQLDYVDGHYVPAPIEDAAGVDARRAALGMPPLADYVCFVNAMQR